MSGTDAHTRARARAHALARGAQEQSKEMGVLRAVGARRPWLSRALTLEALTLVGPGPQDHEKMRTREAVERLAVDFWKREFKLS